MNIIKGLFSGKTDSRANKESWDNKWKQSPVIYSGRALRGKKDRIAVDAKAFITEDDEMLKRIIRNNNLERRTSDDTALAIQQWVVRFLTYKYDDESSNCPEFWQFPFETLQSEVGDCEDGAILISSLLVNAGVPSWRVKVGAGYVQASPTAPQGGHAYCLYLADDNQWRILDWCYYQDSRVQVKDKPLAKDGGQRNAYKDVWFTFNGEHTWAGGSIKVFDSRMSKHMTEKKENVLMEEMEDIVEKILESADKKAQKGDLNSHSI